MLFPPTQMQKCCSYARRVGGLLTLIGALAGTSGPASAHAGLDAGAPSLDAGTKLTLPPSSDAGPLTLTPPRVLDSVPPVYTDAHLSHC